MQDNKNLYAAELEEYRERNQIAKPNGIVLFGASFAKKIPVCELKQAFQFEGNVYNRSVENLSVFQAEQVLTDCVLPLSPKKILLQLGETDLAQGNQSVAAMIQAYEGLIGKLKSAEKHCSIVLVSVCETPSGIHPEQWNQALEDLAHRTRCQYADITAAFSDEAPGVKAFRLLRFFMLDRVTFWDAVALGC